MSELKIKRVVLYKTGLGFFEKHGKIDLKNQKHLKISFKNTTMNDLLKTFSIMRLNGDLQVAGVSYEGQNSNISKILEDSIIKLPKQDVLDTLINQLRGFQAEFTVNDKKFTGIVIGLQSISEPVSQSSEGIIEEKYLMLKENSGSIRKIKLRDIIAIRILDSIAKKDFNFFMDVVQSAKSDNFRNVTIYFNGEEKSEFVLTFLQELPAYKISWRLYLLDQKNEKAETLNIADKNNEDSDIITAPEIPVLLHGWAIIDNVLDEDWESVNLSLVSGLPISFKYDSYSPLFISRPEVKRNQDLSTKTPAHRNRDFAPKPPKPSDKQYKTPLNIVNKIVKNSNVKGSGYQYKIPMRVTVKRNQSSLIPIIQANTKAKMVSVYNSGANKDFALQTLEFTNDTGMVVEEGPISVFQGDVFQGEAMLPYLEKKEKQRIPYSVNQSIKIITKVKSKYQKTHKVQLKKQLLDFYFLENQTEYSLKNIAEYSQVLILEHPISSNYDLFDSLKPDEKTKNYYRFRIGLNGSEHKKIILKERRLLSKKIQFANVDESIVEAWKKLTLISENEYTMLLKIIDFAKKETEITNKIANLKNRVAIISKEQTRIRENMKVLQKSESEKKLLNRYVEKFELRETEIEKIDKDILALNDKLTKITKEKHQFIEKQFL